MVRGEDVGEELDLALPHGARQDAADQLVGLVARRHQKARLDSARRDEEDRLGVKVSNGISHGAASEQVERQVAALVGYLQPARRRVSSWGSYCGTPVPDRYSAGNRVRGI